MYPRSSAQDVYRCDLCETAIVDSYCDFCSVNLCKSCIGEHILDGYDKHKIVLFEERRSTLIFPKCEMHPQKNCKFQCKDCNDILVCSSCTASTQHKGHDFVEVKEVIKKKKEAIKKDRNEIENISSPTYEEIALDLENQLANLDEGYQKLTTIMSTHGEQWHNEIDIVINKMKSEITEIKVKHREILQKHLDEIKQIQSLMKQSLLALKEIEKSTQVSSILEYISKINEFSKIPPKVKVTLPTFIPKAIDHKKLCSLFGQITPLSTSTEENTSSFIQPNTLVRELLEKPKPVATIQTKFKLLCSVSCLNENNIWTSGWCNTIKCFNIEGSLIQKITTRLGEGPNDIAVDNEGNLLYLNYKTKTVNKVKNEQTEELIRLQGWTPLNLCVTIIGDLLVIMYSNDRTQSKVVRYSKSKEIQTIQFDNEGKPLYSGESDIKCITENRKYEICVADFKAGALVSVDQDGKFKWRYTGYPSETKSQPFLPRGITTDSQSHFLTADCNNHCIHILDQSGQFLHYIDNCNLNDPWGVCVDNDDNLFVAVHRNGNVKKIKYLK